MASFEQIIKLESEKPHGVVRLVEANGFYRAYNHSETPPAFFEARIEVKSEK